MANLGILLRSARAGLVQVVALAGMFAAASAAQAQVEVQSCLPFDASIPVQIAVSYLDELSTEWVVPPNDQNLCSKLTPNFTKACENMVRDALRCHLDDIQGSSRQNQIACKALAGASAASCVAGVQKDTASALQQAKEEWQGLLEDCAASAAALFRRGCLLAPN
jgi:hypothetical protein